MTVSVSETASLPPPEAESFPASCVRFVSPADWLPVGLVSVLGLSAGSFLLCLTAAFGVAAVIAASALAYDLLRS